MYVDALAEALDEWPGGIVSAGGDMRIWGTDEDGKPWTIGLEHPSSPDSDILDLHLTDAGVATSGRNRRRWLRDGTCLHHIIDPRTGKPVESSLVTMTVVASTAVNAEIVATALFVGFPSDDLANRLRDMFLVAIGIDDQGRVHIIQGKEESDVAA
jgi:thiamine biosynthesis lipoprotein